MAKDKNIDKKDINNNIKDKYSDYDYDNDTSLTQDAIFEFKPELRPGFKLEDLFNRQKKK